MRYIDAFNHFFPKRIYELMLQSPAGQKDLGKRMQGIPALYDVEERLRVVDSFPDYTQVICLGMPALDRLTGPAPARLVFSGIMDRFPNLKVITHHLGGIIPYFEGRVAHSWDQLGARTSDEDYSLILKKLKKRPFDYFKGFYGDTALAGARAPTICGISFFGPDHVLFASDCPFDKEKGKVYIRSTTAVIDTLH